MVRKRLLISGLVQGVGYRKWFERQALELGLTGWVRNLPSGEVEAEIQGEAPMVDRIVTSAKQGPRFSKVDAVQCDELRVVAGEIEFVIQRAC